MSRADLSITWLELEAAAERDGTGSPKSVRGGLAFWDGALDGGGGAAFGVSGPLDLVWGDIPWRKNS